MHPVQDLPLLEYLHAARDSSRRPNIAMRSSSKFLQALDLLFTSLTSTLCGQYEQEVYCNANHELRVLETVPNTSMRG
jgi:hypothetical protein